MKKTLASLLLTGLLMDVAGCGGGDNKNAPTSPPAPTQPINPNAADLKDKGK